MMVIKPALSSPRLPGRNEFVCMKEVEQAVVTLKPFTDDDKIKNYLGRFPWTEITPDNCRRLTDLVEPGGRRKIAALDDLGTRTRKPIVARCAD